MPARSTKEQNGEPFVHRIVMGYWFAPRQSNEFAALCRTDSILCLCLSVGKLTAVCTDNLNTGVVVMKSAKDGV
jgi:hypothetical protein